MSDNEESGCFGCADLLGYRVRHSSYFRDTRTGRLFCAECTSALVQWELDGVLNDPDLRCPSWIAGADTPAMFGKHVSTAVDD